MRKLRIILTLLLALLWLPATAHCLLFESTASLEFLACCTHPEPPAPVEHHEDECATDPCSIVESAQYKSSLQRLTVPPFYCQIVFELPPPNDIEPALHTNSVRCDTAPELPTGWQFTFRSALPPRAPSRLT